MKKLVLLFIIALAVFALVACGGEQATEPPESVTPEPQGSVADVNGSDDPEPVSPTDAGEDYPDNDEPQTLPEFTFEMNGAVIYMDQDISFVLEKLGEPRGVFEIPSCAFEGSIDRAFDYPGIEIHTYEKDGNNHIYQIVFTDDTVRTSEGRVRLGQSIQAAIDAYGDDYEYETGLYTFTRGRTALRFLVVDDEVDDIAYTLLFD